MDCRKRLKSSFLYIKVRLMCYEIDRIIYGRIEKTILAARMNPIMARIVIRESCSQLRGS